MQSSNTNYKLHDKGHLNNAGDTIYLMLINQLIELNKIKTIKKAQNHLQDIIKEKIED